MRLPTTSDSCGLTSRRSVPMRSSSLSMRHIDREKKKQERKRRESYLSMSIGAPYVCGFKLIKMGMFFWFFEFERISSGW